MDNLLIKFDREDSDTNPSNGSDLFISASGAGNKAVVGIPVTE
jgi:hypothetical protein